MGSLEKNTNDFGYEWKSNLDDIFIKLRGVINVFSWSAPLCTSPSIEIIFSARNTYIYISDKDSQQLAYLIKKSNLERFMTCDVYASCRIHSGLWISYLICISVSAAGLSICTVRISPLIRHSQIVVTKLCARTHKLASERCRPRCNRHFILASTLTRFFAIVAIHI